MLEKNGANYTIANEEGVTLLHTAAATGENSVQKKIFKQFMLICSHTPFLCQFITYKGNEQIVNAIISYGGADLNVKDQYVDDTPLMKAIHSRNTKLL